MISLSDFEHNHRKKSFEHWPVLAYCNCLTARVKIVMWKYKFVLDSLKVPLPHTPPLPHQTMLLGHGLTVGKLGVSTLIRGERGMILHKAYKVFEHFFLTLSELLKIRAIMSHVLCHNLWSIQPITMTFSHIVTHLLCNMHTKFHRK